MQSSQSFTELARELSTSFRVHVPDRRGRGRSGPFGPEYGLPREIEDLDALLGATDSRFVLGLSSGALIALAGARVLPAIERLAVYEPPLTVEGANPAAWVPRYLRDVDRGRLASAMVTVIQGTGDVDVMSRLPRTLLVPLMALALRADAMRADREPDRVRIRDLVATVRCDAQIQGEANQLLIGVSDLTCKVLLMGGERSHPALRIGLDALAARLPDASCVRFAMVGHLAADNSGRPKAVAAELRKFFG